MRSRGIGLVRAQRIWGGARTSGTEPRDPQFGQQARQGWGISRLTRREDQHQGQSATVDQCVGLGAQTATRASDGVIVRLVATTTRILVIR